MADFIHADNRPSKPSDFPMVVLVDAVANIIATLGDKLDNIDVVELCVKNCTCIVFDRRQRLKDTDHEFLVQVV